MQDTPRRQAFLSQLGPFEGADGSSPLDRYQTFVRFFKDCRSVLDLECGRGEFLELLGRSGIGATGLTSDPETARAAQGAGAVVEHDDVCHFLETTGLRYDGIFAANVIEHLAPDGVERLLSLCRRVLRPGGVIVLVAPNFTPLSAGSTKSWRDPGPARPCDLESIGLFLRRAGFETLMSGTNSRSYNSPLADLFRAGDPPYDWPPPYPEVKYQLFNLYPPPPRRRPAWARFVKAIVKAALHSEMSIIEENIRRLYYHLVTLYPPAEIFCVAKLGEAEATRPAEAITIVIPNWNGKRFLATCLGSLNQQSAQGFETIVVDNGSTDGSLEFLRDSFSEVKVISLETNTGFAHAVNVGIKAARGAWVFLLNNDTEVHPDCVREILHALDRYPGDGFFSCKMINYHSRDILDGTGDCVPRNLNAFRRGQFCKDSPIFEVSLHVFGACAGAAIYKRQTLLEVGLFDEDFFCYYEDVDLSFRLRLAGHACRYLPKACVYHIGSGTSESRFTPFIAQSLARNKIFVLVKTMSWNLILRNFRQLLWGELFRIAQFARHGLLRSYFAGLWRALTRLPAMVRKRRQILGSAKVSDEDIHRLMLESEQWSIPAQMVAGEHDKG